MFFIVFYHVLSCFYVIALTCIRTIISSYDGGTINKTKIEEWTAIEGMFNQRLLRNIDYYLINMCCKVDRNPIKKLAYRFKLVDAKYLQQLHIALLHFWWRFGE